MFDARILELNLGFFVTAPTCPTLSNGGLAKPCNAARFAANLALMSIPIPNL